MGQPENMKQHVFNIVVTGLLKQGRKSRDSEGRCAFRGLAGRKCAIGFLIPDDRYDPVFEETGFREGSTMVPLLESLYPGLDFEFCQALVSVHDNWPTDVWKERLGYVAGIHGLQMPVT